MNKGFRCALVFLFFVSFFTSCKKDDNTEASVYFGENYFPMQVDDSLIYDVNVHTKDLNEYDSSYQILERVESVISDAEGRPTFRLERYTRTTPNDPWVIFNVWTTNVTSDNVEKKENNITYIKLVFPLQQNKTWNGNVKNILGDQQYEITDIHQPLIQNNLVFDSVLTVNQANNETLVDKQFAQEKFATNVGMIYKEKTEYEFIITGSGTDTSKIFEYTEILNYHN